MKNKAGRFAVMVWDDFQFDEDAAECGRFDTFDEALAYARARVSVDRADSDSLGEGRTPDGVELDTMTSFSIPETDGRSYQSWEDPTSWRYPTAADFQVLEANGYPEFLLKSVRDRLLKLNPEFFTMQTKPLLGPRYQDALQFAFEAHQGQVRKRTKIPYISHPLAVSSMVLEFGGSEDQAIAALLHDTIEDCGVKRAELEKRFGATVALIVAECTDTDVHPKPEYEERKKKYLEHLLTASAETLLVCACDKLHNARAICRDVRAEGPKTWNRFSAPSSVILWYFRSLLKIFEDNQERGKLPAAICAELRELVAEMKRLSDQG